MARAARSPTLCPVDSRLSLSSTQLSVLRDLRRKQLGAEVGWTPIAVAQSLTELGLAARQPSGWRITPAGAAMLDGREDVVVTSDMVLQFGPRVHRSDE